MDSAPPRRRHWVMRWWPVALVIVVAAVWLVDSYHSHSPQLVPVHLGVEAPPGVRVAHAFTDRWYAPEPTWRLHLIGGSNELARIARGAGFVPTGGPAPQPGSGWPRWWARALGRDRWISCDRAGGPGGGKHQVEALYIHESGTELLYSGFDP